MIKSEKKNVNFLCGDVTSSVLKNDFGEVHIKMIIFAQGKEEEFALGKTECLATLQAI